MKRELSGCSGGRSTCADYGRFFPKGYRGDRKYLQRDSLSPFAFRTVFSGEKAQLIKFRYEPKL
jgi:hypothetical protein